MDTTQTTASRKGSQRQLQLYIEHHRDEIDDALRSLLPADLGGASFEWRSPVPPRYQEFQDGAFLKAVGQDALTPDLAEFWPSRGPVWDGLAVVRGPGDAAGVVLVEAKAHASELRGGGSKAESPASQAKIASALHRTQERLEVPTDTDWADSAYYQHANRLAHALWLRQHGVPTWFVHLLFLDDHSHMATSRAEWEPALAAAERALGIDGIDIPWAGHVFLPAVSEEA